MNDMNDELLAPTKPEKMYTGKTKSKLLGASLVFVFGPFGFLYYGFGAAVGAFVCYAGLITITGGAAVPFLGILVPLGVYFGADEGVKTDEYRKYEKDCQNYQLAVARASRKKAEDEYYDKLGTTKLKATLFGDPNARAGFVKLVNSVKNGEMKEAFHNLHTTIDPVSATQCEEKLAKEKVSQEQMIIANACCSACQTQNDVGAKFCRECGEGLMKAG